MKFTCLQENLLKGLQIARQSGLKQTTLPVLQNYLIKSQKGSLIISSTNLELSIKAYVRGKEDKEGALTIDQDKFLSYIKNLPQEKIELSSEEGNKLHIESGKDISADFNGISGDEFPEISSLETKHNITIDTKELKKALKLSSVSLPKNDYRPEIAGVYISKKHQLLVFTGTDGFRLTETKLSFPALDNEEFSYIIPSKTVSEIIRILDLIDDEEIGISFGENQVSFTGSQVEVISKLVEGNFPQYEGLIPQDFSRTLNIDKEEFIQAIMLSSVFASDTVNDVKIDCNDKHNISIQSSNNTIGKNSTQIPAALTGEPNFSITFNYSYLLDGINSCSGDVVTLYLNDSDSPAILKGDNRETFLYLVMPIRE